MFKTYLKRIGIEYLIKDLKNVSLNDFVKHAFEKKIHKLSSKNIKDLYVYDIPKLSADGSCSILEEKNDMPYDLSKIFGHSPSQTLCLWRLKQVVKNLYELTDVNWLGIYKKAINPKGEVVLVKESYLGFFSRPEFPLTKNFAKKSNNSTVGLTGKAKVIQDVSANEGPYYKCDGKVQSEFCLPIYSSKQARRSRSTPTTENSEIVGIIDAEAFPKNFFTNDNLLQIAKVAYDLGNPSFNLLLQNTNLKTRRTKTNYQLAY